MRLLLAGLALATITTAAPAVRADGGAVEVRKSPARESSASMRMRSTRMLSEGAIVAGCVLLPLGITATVGGVALIASEHSKEGRQQDGADVVTGQLALVSILVGIPMTFTGFGLVLHGTNRVPSDPAAAIALGPTGATLHGRW